MAAAAQRRVPNDVIMVPPQGGAGRRSVMGLDAVLSNQGTEVLFQRLTARDWKQVHRQPAQPRDRTRNGRLKFGTVSGAMLAVLAEADGPLRYMEIHSRVEQKLGFPVGKSSTKQLLHLESRRTKQRIERISRGVYRLASSPD